MSKLALAFLVAIAFAKSVLAQQSASDRKSNQPIKPFRVVANIYYVGANEVTSFLIADNAGHILLDAGFAETAPLIQQNIEALGFHLADVKILLNSQAHFDHAGGLAQLKALTGARLIAIVNRVSNTMRSCNPAPPLAFMRKFVGQAERLPYNNKVRHATSLASEC